MKFIERTLLKEVKDHLNKREISLIVGARRVGKTTLINIIRRYLDKKGGKTVYFTLDLESDKTLFSSQEKVIKRLIYEARGAKRLYVFIDEIQSKENAGLFLKGIYDYLQINNIPIKLIVTGSGSLELKEKIHESLAGRKRVFALFSLSFFEYLRFKHKLGKEKDIDEFAEIHPARLYESFLEYSIFGGYPQVILAETQDEKKKILEEIYSAYVEKDIRLLLNIEKTQAFSNLVKLLASQIGNLISKNELARTLGIAQRTVDSYIWYLEKTFMIKVIPPFYKNVRKEITKAPIVYFNDLGMRSFAKAQFAFDPKTGMDGFVFENFVYRLLRESLKAGEKIRFWRSLTGAEVDFIVGTYNKPIPVEVKMRTFKGKVAYGKSYYSFLKKYHPKIGFLYNLDTQKQEKIHDSIVYSLRYYEKIK